MRPARLLTLLFVAGLVGAAATAAAADPEPRASARAFAVLVKPAGGSVIGSSDVTAPPQGAADVPAFAYPADGSIVRVGATAASARTGPGAAARAAARVTLRDLELFGGEVTVASAAVAADATASRTAAGGDLSRSAVVELRVGGDPVAAFSNQRLPLGDWGYAVVLEQAVQRSAGAERGFRGFVTGLHVYLTADHGGLPAGSEILVGYAEAAARWPLPEPSVTEEPTDEESGDANSGGLPDEPTVKPPGATPEVPAIVLNPPDAVKPHLTGAGYVFPVYGDASFSDDFGYPRADTVWHHGNDIFAPVGTPVLAVADGTLFSVGWNRLGGWRLWLRDRQGHEYYYAHLSAYSPLAENGAQVKAGDVIGFVGATGDAVGTPPHLHFEIHPAALLGLGYDGVVDPYEYLVAWQQALDVVFGVASAQNDVAAKPAPEPGAVVLDAVDIASSSGLEPGGLERMLALPVLAADGSVLLPAEAPSLIGAPPGFSVIG